MQEPLMSQILQYRNSKAIRMIRLFRTIFVQGLYFMDYLLKIERRIKKNFPEITPQELEERLKILKGMVALKHDSKGKILQHGVKEIWASCPTDTATQLIDEPVTLRLTSFTME